jgi:hypothetical protein
MPTEASRAVIWGSICLASAAAGMPVANAQSKFDGS